MKIKAKKSNFNGITAGIVFKHGVGESDDLRALNYLVSQGYTIVESEAATPPPKTTVKEKGGHADAGKD